MKVTAIIQARMGSTRFPGKSLIEFGGKSLIQHAVERAKAASRVDQIIVATTTSEKDDCLADYVVQKLGMPVFRGHETDVLGRYAAAAQTFGGDVIVRLTGDDPLKDPAIIDLVIGHMVASGDTYDYVSNTILPTFPEGLDCEAMVAERLQEAAAEATKSYDREHVTPFFYNNPDRFRIFNVALPFENHSQVRWTLDNEADLYYFRELFKLIDSDRILPWRDVLAVVNQHTELTRVNATSIRSDRYLSPTNLI